MSLLYLLGAYAFAVLADVYDTTISEKGIKAGIAVEANYTWLYGTNKPSTFQYYIVNIPIITLTCGVSLAAYLLHSPAFYYAGLAAPIAIGVKHIQGGLEWKALGIKF
jgi:hypothetical protein